jgi:hypothetical protein
LARKYIFNACTARFENTTLVKNPDLLSWLEYKYTHLSLLAHLVLQKVDEIMERTRAEAALMDLMVSVPMHGVIVYRSS